MSEQEPPSPPMDWPVTEDVVATTPPRKESSAKNIGTFDGNKDGSDDIITTPVRTNSGDPITAPLRAAGEIPQLPTVVMTPIRSRPGTPARSESPFPLTPIPSRSDLSLASKSEEQEQEKTCPKWSDALRTQPNGDKFSPSKTLNTPGSLHGLGKNHPHSIIL